MAVKTQVDVSWNDVETYIENGAKWIEEHYDHDLDFIIAISRGGLIPGTMMSHRLRIPLLVVDVKSYDDKSQTQQLESVINQEFRLNKIKDKNVLLVDDICDTGNTIKLLRDRYFTTVNDIFTFVLHLKEGASQLPLAGCQSEVKPSCWIMYPWELS
tara:strand:+ start:6175 stop:6645 length:471 start_codon:yes stop_codon:yes gene_type:complete